MELALPFLVFGAVLAVLYLTGRWPSTRDSTPQFRLFLAAWALIVLAMFAPRPLMAVLLAGSGALMIFQARAHARPFGVGLLLMGFALIAVAVVVAVQ